MDRPSESLRFPRAAIATPHYLATQTGASVLARGGTAIDACIAANLVLAVVTPYYCGFGGDLFALVWDGRAHQLHALHAAGRSPAAATIDGVRARAGTDQMPVVGPHSVTVPGAVGGWFALLDRFGTHSFGDLADDALRLAADGFEITGRGGSRFAAGSRAYRRFPGWSRLFGEAAAGGVFRQPLLARLLATVASGGPDVFYRGPVARAIAQTVAGEGGFLTERDVHDHRPEWVAPLRAPYRDVEVVELGPPTQGVSALEALRITDGFSLPPAGAMRTHLLVEATKLALADRDAYVADPATMPVPPGALLDAGFVTTRRSRVVLDRAIRPEPGVPQRGDTAFLCAADAHGTLVALIQSNFLGFGSGVAVDDWGFMLQNRGSSFRLDAAHPNALAGGKLPLHTLIPAMAFRDGRPWLVFGAMGGDGQPQTHLQLLTHLVDDGSDPQAAIDAPRFKVDPGSWVVRIEPRVGEAMLADLAARGHELEPTGAWDDTLGHAHAIVKTAHGYAVATDPRAEGAAAGI